jgi:hypothetical protein
MQTIFYRFLLQQTYIYIYTNNIFSQSCRLFHQKKEEVHYLPTTVWKSRLRALCTAAATPFNGNT